VSFACVSSFFFFALHCKRNKAHRNSKRKTDVVEAAAFFFLSLFCFVLFFPFDLPVFRRFDWLTGQYCPTLLEAKADVALL
jgi:uncharacterized MAPEG superfamily protein